MVPRRSQKRRRRRMADVETNDAEARRRLRMCRGKAVYADDWEAIHGAICASRSSGRAYRIYRCPYCRGYHLTTETERAPF